MSDEDLHAMPHDEAGTGIRPQAERGTLRFLPSMPIGFKAPKLRHRSAIIKDGRYVQAEGERVSDKNHPRQRHEWRQWSDDEKPWTCILCGFYTANLRHIEKGFCRHEWGQRLDMTCCIRCGVVMNNGNAESPCIGSVRLELRRRPTEGGGFVYTDDEPLNEA